MTIILINDVIYMILMHLSLGGVLKFSRINKQFAEVCRSERGCKEIKRKEQQYIETLIAEVLNIGESKLFALIRQDYIPYLSNNQYKHFIKEIYQVAEERKYILELFYIYIRIRAAIYFCSCKLDNHELLVIEENRRVLSGFLYHNKQIVRRLRTDIDYLILKFDSQDNSLTEWLDP